MPRQRVRRKGEREAADAAGSTSWKSCKRDKGGKEQEIKEYGETN
jgi:hypothetical protein